MRPTFAAEMNLDEKSGEEQHRRRTLACSVVWVVVGAVERRVETVDDRGKVDDAIVIRF